MWIGFMWKLQDTIWRNEYAHVYLLGSESITYLKIPSDPILEHNVSDFVCLRFKIGHGQSSGILRNTAFLETGSVSILRSGVGYTPVGVIRNPVTISSF